MFPSHELVRRSRAPPHAGRRLKEARAPPVGKSPPGKLLRSFWA
jgi:hypothetical protein